MKKILALVAIAGLASGCGGTMRNSIPVVDSGTTVRPDGAVVQPQSQPSHGVRQGPVVVYKTDEKPYISEPEVMTMPTEAIMVEHEEKPGVSRTEQQMITDSGVAQVASPSPRLDAPVQALLNTAQQQKNRGDLEGAAASVERAQRIAPREPQVLYRLAEVRLAQGDAKDAEQIAQRAVGLSSGQPGLQAGLWDLIAEARDRLGDDAGAAVARSKARVNL